MSYRKLGRTGMMISEVVSGGDPITLENYKQLELALEMGLNYLDMAPAYNQGNCERAYGKLLAGSSAKREKVYLTTKISGFSQIRERLYKETLRQAARDQAGSDPEAIADNRERRGVEKPGYYLTYFPGQMKAFEPAYLTVAMQRDYADQVDGSDALRKHMVESIEGSLKRVGTDYFDLAMCPHGATSPEELDCPEILDVFNDLKQQGKVRFLGVTSHNDPAGILRKAAAARALRRRDVRLQRGQWRLCRGRHPRRQWQGRRHHRHESGDGRGHPPQVAPASARLAYPEGRTNRPRRNESACESLPLGASKSGDRGRHLEPLG